LSLEKRGLEPCIPGLRICEAAGEVTGEGGKLDVIEPLGLKIGGLLRVDAGLMSGTDPIHGLGVPGPEHRADTDAQSGGLKADIDSDVFGHGASPSVMEEHTWQDPGKI
jgi:hypothetical protein